MLNIFSHRRRHVPEPGITRVAILGDRDRRAFVKAILGKRVEHAGELASDRRVTLLGEVAPEIVFLDCGSDDVNPLISLPVLACLPGSPRIIALIDRYSAARLNEQILRDLGANAVIDIHDTTAISHAAGLTAEQQFHESQRRLLSPGRGLMRRRDRSFVGAYCTRPR